MDRKEIKQKIIKDLGQTEVLGEAIGDYFFDTTLPEVLRDVLIESEATDCDEGYCTGVSMSGRRLSHNERIGYNMCIKDIKKQAKEKYNITL